jgi:hypothetical protein
LPGSVFNVDLPPLLSGFAGFLPVPGGKGESFFRQVMARVAQIYPMADPLLIAY